MKVLETPIPDLLVAELEPRGDDRGFFARAFCRDELAAAGVADTAVLQINDSFSARKGTLRGMHYQLPPSAETKMVRCIRGALWDVALDLRPDSATFGQWHGVELTAENRRMLIVPRGFAHGFMTLTDETEMLYFVTAAYDPERERGVRWNDPRFGIRWPMDPVVISEKDAGQRGFDPDWHLP
ncbi:dTDP-4-dehydrorhamnose 3,5-epimerase [Caenispirillum salinarum AK4]|uniref:dTDP-4-dehydrorhamnose 3,5-epimerase n=1 Tax=Caenispirillum salinarum AK4 TaxID=1238182 RepID=K9HCR5_9PROT|nr:dTDP-4-dehydrorhamnose 3,5-epimerase [Caenispirillum salinarum]EKV26541.1 dTDP-4-dehydrorhamnose 3,5-epimerase [Caenispirillum salinarum AK4]